MNYKQLYEYLESAMYYDDIFQKKLREQHAENYEWLDDEMSDDLDEWLSELDPEAMVQDYFDHLHDKAKKKHAEVIKRILEAKSLTK